jgi:8-oxo-dGTP diphosphatase
MTKPNIIHKTALAAVKNKKVIMVRETDNQEVFYMLGGTIEPGESVEDCLRREVAEEISTNITPGTLKYLSEFQDVAHGRLNTLVNIKLYFGKLEGAPKPSAEIAEIKYFDSNINPKHLTPISTKIFKWLKQNHYIG